MKEDIPSLESLVRGICDELLFGPTIEDIQHMIEPDAGLRVLRQGACPHGRWDIVRQMCLDCGITKTEMTLK